MTDEGSGNEKMRELAEIKTRLEKKISETETELENLRTLLEFVSTTLVEKGFKRATSIRVKPAEKAASSPVGEELETIPLNTRKGDLLANLHLSRNTIRVVPAQGKMFNVKTPPFRQFLIERVLDKMREKDNSAASKGKIPFDKTISYEVTTSDDLLEEVLIHNVSKERARELRSSIHWTLEKMYEKTGGTV